MKKWTSISITTDIKDRLEKYILPRESWNECIERLLNELDAQRILIKKYRLK